MKRYTIADVILMVAVVVLVACTLAPAVARMHRSFGDAKCQANLQRLAEAMALYCADNHGRCPTNRLKTSGTLNYYQPLSPPSTDPTTGKPMRFVYSVNWVEALYAYLWDSAEKTDQDWTTFRCCPRTSNKTWPSDVGPLGYPYPSMSYVLNYNLVEQSPECSHNLRKLMMLREFPYTTIAQLRPTVSSVTYLGMKPTYAFCNGDIQTSPTENNDSSFWKLHGEGSHIVFADGHVRFFALDYYPKNHEITATTSWDSETGQWWNFAPGSGKGAPYLKSIAITP